jgi:hypothetical protein
MARPSGPGAVLPDSEQDTIEQPTVPAAAGTAAAAGAPADTAASAAADTAAGDTAAAKQAAAEQTMALLLSLAVLVPDQAVPDIAVPNVALPDVAVPSRVAVPNRTVPGLAVPGRTGPGRTGPGRTGPGRTGPGRTGPGRGRAGPGVRAWAGLGTARAWPVGVILAAQAAGSLRLIWSNSASAAEARYLLVGRAQLAAPGALRPAGPVLAPLAGAIASSAGGLAAARLESLVLMLAATVLVHGVTRRLFDRRSAFFAAAFFAGLAGAAFLGAVAGPGALALAALALAAWLGIRAAGTAGWSQLTLAAAAGTALAVANMTSYAAGPGDLIVLAVTALAVWCACGGAAAARAAAVLSTAGLAVTAAVLLHGGPAAWPGQAGLLLSRVLGASPGLAWTVGGPPPAAVQATARWAGALALLAVAGALVQIAARQGWQIGAVSAILATAVAVAPGCYGAWFACAGGGYAVASLARVVPRAKYPAAFAAGLGLVILAAVPGISLAARQFGWPDAAPVTVAIPAVLARQPGPVLADDADVLRYYLGRDLAARNVVAAGPAGQGRPDAAACRAAIRRHYFGIIALAVPRGGQRGAGLAPEITLAGYRQVAAVPYATTARDRGAWIIWVRGRRG